MYSLEFETKLKDRYIEIPEYERFRNKHIKISLSCCDGFDNEENYIKNLINDPIKTKGEKFLTREEANER